MGISGTCPPLFGSGDLKGCVESHMVADLQRGRLEPRSPAADLAPFPNLSSHHQVEQVSGVSKLVSFMDVVFHASGPLAQTNPVFIQDLQHHDVFTSNNMQWYDGVLNTQKEVIYNSIYH